MKIPRRRIGGDERLGRGGVTSHVRLERVRRQQREVRRRGARVPRAPAVLVEVLGAAHGVPPLDAALRHAVLAFQLGRAPGAALAPLHHVPLALLEFGQPLALVERLRALKPFAAAVEALGAQYASLVLFGVAV